MIGSNGGTMLNPDALRYFADSLEMDLEMSSSVRVEALKAAAYALREQAARVEAAWTISNYFNEKPDGIIR